jgi:dihydroorotase
VTPHHLTLTDEIVAFGALGGDDLMYETNAKVNPPLRSQDDVDACVAALADGTIDCIATDHAPHAVIEKLCEFDEAAFGISGLETAFGLCMRLRRQQTADSKQQSAPAAPAIELATLIARMTTGPVRALGLDRVVPGIGTLGVGAPADVAVLDPDAEWAVEPERFASKGKNTPIAGLTLRGAVMVTIAGGKIVYERAGVPVG